MKKVFLYLLALLVLNSCDNLKKKDKDSDDNEEVTTKKKKKPVDEEEITEEEEQPKKKKKPKDDEMTVVDEDDNTNTDDNASEGWSSSQRKQFIKDCAKVAENTATSEQAQIYCECMTEIAEQKFNSAAEANRGINGAWVKKYAPGCNAKLQQ